MKLYKGQTICFDDILIVPQKSNVRSRHKVDLTMSIGHGKRKLILKAPIISAPMDTVSDIEMCIVMSNFGGLGILHRHMSGGALIDKTKMLADAECRFGVSVGATNEYMKDAESLYNAGARIILIDIANGHSFYAIDAVKALRKNLPDDLHIMAGNVATAEGFLRLSDAGADSVRVGIGGGSACTTRIVSGHGVPTLSSIIDVSDYMMFSDRSTCSIIADGGIRSSGDMVKAFAAGADAVMIGSMLAGTDESPGNILTDSNGSKVKIFRGMASSAAQNDAKGAVSVSEGVSSTVSYKGSVKNILNQIIGGLGSGCSYSGVESLCDLYLKSECVVVTEASTRESMPHTILGEK
jgi:IMP dehydrogenase